MALIEPSPAPPNLTPRPTTALVVVLWLIVALFSILYAYLNLVSLRGFSFVDFHVYHVALQRAAAGEAVYNLAEGLPFLYPPFYLIILWPIGWLGEPAAMTTWLYLQNFWLAVSFVALLVAVRSRVSLLAPLAAILFTGFSPVMLNNLYGQTNLLYLALLSVFILGYMRSLEPGRRNLAWEIAAALALSAAINIRVLPGALLVLAALQRRRRLVALTVAFVAAEVLATGLAFGFATEWEYFTSYIFQLRGHENMREISLLKLAEDLLSPRPGLIVFAVLVAAGLIVFFAFLLRPVRRLEPTPTLHLAFVIASMVLFAPLLEYHHYTILLASYVLVLGALERSGRLSLTSALPVFLSWAIVSGANYLSFYQFAAVAFVGLAGATLIWAYSAWLIIESKTASAAPAPDPPPATR